MTNDNIFLTTLVELPDKKLDLKPGMSISVKEGNAFAQLDIGNSYIHECLIAKVVYKC
jgi:hypothetical protein